MTLETTLNQRVGGSTPPRPTISSGMERAKRYRSLRRFRTFDALSISVIQGPFRLDPHRIALYWSNTIAANVAELVDALDLGSSGEPVGVRVSPFAPLSRGFPPQSRKFLA